MKLGSEFLKEFDKYERPIIGGRTKRQVIFLIGVILGVGLSISLYFLHIPQFVSGFLLLVVISPFMIYGMGKDIELKEKLRFRLTVQERVYLTEYRKGKGFTKDDFKPTKTQEADES